MKGKFFLCVIFLSSLVFSFGFAQQISEDRDVMSLREIKVLIKQKEYNSALEELYKYIQEKPKDFDNAQKLINEIMKKRELYFDYAQQAIKSNTENPEDHETPSKIILEMRKIENNPPVEIRKMINMLEQMHLFKYYAYLFDSIQKQSSESTLAKNFTQSVKIIQDGFWIYKDEFYAEYKDNPELLNSVTEVVNNLNENINSVLQSRLKSNLEKNVNEYVQAITEENYKRALQEYEDVYKNFEEYNLIISKILENSSSLVALQEQTIDEETEVTDASYLSFMNYFILGLPSYVGSGLLGAVCFEWANYVEQMKEATNKLIQKYTDIYVENVPKNLEVSDVTTLLGNHSNYADSIAKYCVLARDVNNLYGIQESNLPFNYPVNFYNDSYNYLEKLCLQNERLLNLAIEVDMEIASENITKNRFTESKEDEQSILPAQILLFANTSKNINNLFSQKDRLSLSSFDWANEYNQIDATQNQNEYVDNQKKDFGSVTSLYENLLEQLYQIKKKHLISSWQNIALLDKKYADNFVDYATLLSEKAVVLNSGLSFRISDNDVRKFYSDINYVNNLDINSSDKNALLKYKYSGISKDIILHLDEYIDSAIQNLTNNKNQLSENKALYESSDLKNYPFESISTCVSYIDTSINKLNQLKNQNFALLQEIEDSLQLFRVTKDDADSILQDSKDVFAQGDFSRAERLLQQASEKYALALSYCEDYELRQKSDEERFNLAQNIASAKNEIVVQESRRLYTQARTAQNNDNYDEAEQYIIAAINKWAETHDEENTEFEDFRNLVNTAISMKTGRTLTPADPLYSEISTLLSYATGHYDKANEYLKNGDKKAADKELKSALNNINKIRDAYPINQDASLLLLKINRIQNPAKFEEEFELKINAAIAGCRKKDTQLESYNLLMDYYNLAPDYKGLKDKIYNIQIELGMRQKPVDNSAATQAKKITKEAQRLFNSAGNDVAKLNIALAKINESLRINPNNNEAENLKDKISTKIGASTTIVLSAEEQALYNDAVVKLQRGYVDDANIIVNQLLQNPKNGSSKLIKELKKKIDARL